MCMGKYRCFVFVCMCVCVCVENQIDINKWSIFLSRQLLRGRASLESSQATQLLSVHLIEFLLGEMRWIPNKIPWSCVQIADQYTTWVWEEKIRTLPKQDHTRRTRDKESGRTVEGCSESKGYTGKSTLTLIYCTINQIVTAKEMGF